jgi:hypothetical protein
MHCISLFLLQYMAYEIMPNALHHALEDGKNCNIVLDFDVPSGSTPTSCMAIIRLTLV